MNSIVKAKEFIVASHHPSDCTNKGNIERVACQLYRYPRISQIVRRCTNLFPRWEVNQNKGLCTAVTLLVHCLFTCTCLKNF